MDKYQAWNGAVSTSEKLLKEQVIEIVWAPYLEKSNKLVFTETRTIKSLIGGFDLYRGEIFGALELYLVVGFLTRISFVVFLVSFLILELCTIF